MYILTSAKFLRHVTVTLDNMLDTRNTLYFEAFQTQKIMCELTHINFWTLRKNLKWNSDHLYS